MRFAWMAIGLAACSYAPSALTPDGAAGDTTPGDGDPQAWLDPWAHRKSITIDASKVEAPGDGALTDFPVAIVVLDTEIGAAALANGADIAFTAADGTTRLDSEVESFGNDQLVAWVKVPSLSATIDTELYVYYGNPSPTGGNPAGVWSADYLAVWHLSQDPAQHAAGDIRDATAAHHDGQAEASMTASDSVAGEVGRGIEFDGSNDFIDVPSTIDVGSQFTLSAWVSLAPSSFDIKTIFSNSLSGLDKDGFRLFVNSFNTSDRRILLETSNGTTALTAVTNTNAVVANQFTHVAAVVDRSAGTATLFVNGVDATINATISTSFATASDVEIGRMEDLYEYAGRIDQVELASTLRPAQWLLTTFRNQHEPSTFFAVGAEQTK